MKLIIVLSVIYVARLSAEIEKCDNHVECLVVAGLDNINMEQWPLSICEQNEVLPCLYKAQDSCKSMVNQKLIDRLDSICGCITILRNCQPDISLMFSNTSLPEDIANIPTTICSHLGNIGKCIQDNALTSSCPGHVINTLASSMSYVQLQCQNQGCIASIGQCALQSFGVLYEASRALRLDDQGIAALTTLCRQAQSLQTCFGEPGAEICDQNVIAMFRDKVEMFTNYCNLIPCYTEVAQCGSVIINNTMTSMNDLGTLKPYGVEEDVVMNVCGGKKSELESCMSSLTKCPPLISQTYHSIVKPYYSKVCEILKCSTKINECTNKLNKNIYTAVKNNKIRFNNVNLDLICKNYEELNTCYKSIGEEFCKKEYIDPLKINLKYAETYCKNECLPKIDTCVSVFSNNLFGNSNKFTNIDKCTSNQDVKSCVSDYLKCMKMDSQTVMYTSLVCSSLVCAETILNCAKNLVDNIETIKFNKYGLEKICLNIKKSYTCLTTIDRQVCASFIIDYVKDQKIKEQIIDRCDRIITIVDPYLPIVTEKQYIALSMKLDTPWVVTLLDETSIKTIKFKDKIETALTEVYKNEKYFKSVKVIRFYQGSIVVDHTVEFLHSLSKSEVIDKSQKLSKTLSEVKNIDVGGDSLTIIESPKVLFKGKTVTMDGTNLCAFHDYLGTCTNGGSCIVKDNKGICKCLEGTEGEFCEHKHNSASSLALSTMILSITILVVSMFI